MKTSLNGDWQDSIRLETNCNAISPDDAMMLGCLNFSLIIVCKVCRLNMLSSTIKIYSKSSATLVILVLGIFGYSLRFILLLFFLIFGWVLPPLLLVFVTEMDEWDLSWCPDLDLPSSILVFYSFYEVFSSMLLLPLDDFWISFI